MKKVKELMGKAVTVERSATIKELAKILSSEKIAGVVVMDKNKIAGVVTDGDLVLRNEHLHPPTYVQILDSAIYTESVKTFESELSKILGATAEEVMSQDVITIEPKASVVEAATLMVEKHISFIPVVEKGKLVGAISKNDLVKLLL